VVTTSPVGVLRKPAGTVALHIAGVLAWVNVDGTELGWRPFSDLDALLEREGRRQSGVFGANVTGFDVTGLAADAAPGDGLVVVLQGTVVNAAACTLSARVNGGTANLHRTGWYGQDVISPTLYGDAASPQLSINSVGGAAGSPWLCIFRVESARSGSARFVECIMAGLVDVPTPRYQVASWIAAFVSIAELQSFGVENTVVNNLAATSTYVARWQ